MTLIKLFRGMTYPCAKIRVQTQRAMTASSLALSLRS
jgi:hypothetical protein